MVDFIGPLSLTGTQYGGTQFAHPFDNDNLDNSFRVNNSVKYSSVNWNGLKFGGLYGLSNSDQFSNSRVFSGGVSYSYLGFNLVAGYMQLNNDINGLTAPAVSNAGGAVAGDNIFVGKRQRVFGGGLTYTFGPATAGFVFTQTRVNRALGIGGGASGTSAGITLDGTFARFNNYEVNARYSLTPSLSLAGSWTYTAGFLDGRHPGLEPVQPADLVRAVQAHRRLPAERIPARQHRWPGAWRLRQRPGRRFVEQQADRRHGRPASSLLTRSRAAITKAPCGALLFYLPEARCRLGEAQAAGAG